MCTGTIYWANIGGIVYGASEEKLGELTGKGNEENFTMSMPCRAVVGKGQKPIDVVGPFGSLSNPRELMDECQIMERDIVSDCEEWWRKHQATVWKK
jgi:tRNA(Arg) A34 adenosine deaminase TadA